MISMEQFLMWQPSAPRETSTDRYYLDVANSLVEAASRRGIFAGYPEKVVERAALAVTGYYQDVIADAGVWRSFINECRKLYGYTVPFFDDGGDYVDYELNRADVRFMVWYALSMSYEAKRVCNPMDVNLLAGADAWWKVLEESYEDAPLPEDYSMAKELELHAEEDREAVYRLGNWLFMHCYLMTPAYALTLSETVAGIDLTKEENIGKLRDLMEQSMSENPTGPLALYLGEWLQLIVRGKLPRETYSEEKEEHKYYRLFTQATGGKIIEFFDSYESLNRFFIEALGWEEGQEHLPQMKGSHDFILKVDPKKGMLLARDIARCIACPDNLLYDREYASAHAMDLLTVRGVCPGDLLKYVCENGWLPDAHFPGGTTETVKSNWDFIARCYLQQYYRGD